MDKRDIMGGPDSADGMDILDGDGRRRESGGDILGAGGKTPKDILSADDRPGPGFDVLSPGGSPGGDILAGR